MRKFLFLILIISSLLPHRLQGQYYDTGQDPALLKWMQIKTRNFRVIYPRSYGKEGIRFAQSLDKAYSDLSALYPGIRAKIPVIIHNYSTESNGYVAWAPSRMELYPAPEQNSIPLDPDRQLALHELTHVMQMRSLNTGFTKALSYLAGQQVPGMVSSLLPLWFLEGDAVYSESLLSSSGRGRTPSFQKELKAVVVEQGKMFRYDKALNGSYRDYVPDYYQTGYQTVVWSYSKFGPGIWKKALKTTGDLPFSVNPVNLSLRKTGSMTKKRLYEEAFDTLKVLWAKDDVRSGYETSQRISPESKHDYSDYVSPVFAGKDSVIAVKSTLYDPPSFVIIDQVKRTEKKLFTPGYGFPWYLSYAGGKLVWTEFRRDPRWENRSWSVIMILDIRTGKASRISSRSRYMSAAISPDGNLIAASENSPDNTNNLVIIDARNGEVLQKIATPGNAYPERPKWDNTGQKIVVISLTTSGEGVISYDMRGKKWETMIAPSSTDIQSVCLRKDSLFFVSSASGTDNGYLRKGDGSVILLTRSRFGVSDLDIRGNSLLFTDYSSGGGGVCIASVPENNAEGEPYNYSHSFLINKVRQPEPKAEAVTEGTYNPLPYHKWLHLFRFHSWMPFYANLDKIRSDPASIKPGLMLLSQNDLSTLISTLGYEYSNNLHQLHYSIKWYGWYLNLESQLDYGYKPPVRKLGTSVGDPSEVSRGYQLTNTVSLPLFFQGGRFSRYLYLSLSSSLQNAYIYDAIKGVFDSQQNEISARLFFSNYQRSALRDISPRWAQTIDLNYSYYPFNRDLYGDIFTARSAFFFPGFFRNNGIKLRLEAERQSPERFIFGSGASFPRGYSEVIMKELRFASVDYFMPLLYPDFNISSLLYITRIRADLFYDYAWVPGRYVNVTNNNGVTLNYQEVPESFKSYGIELMSDFYLFRMPFKISAGVQAAWQIPDELPVIKLLFNIDVFGMNIGQKHL